MLQSVGDVNTAPLAASAASSTDISSCAKHVSVTPKFSMPITDTASPDTAQQREWEIVAKILYYVEWEIDSAINKAIALE